MAAAREVWMSGDRLELKLTGEETGGTLCVCLDHPSPGFRLVPHIHRREDETIHIIEGTFEFMLDDVTRTIGPGDTVHIPRGTVHAIRNTGDTTGRRLLTFHPAGIEDFFRAAGTAAPGEARDPVELMALAREHGWEFVSVS